MDKDDKKDVTGTELTTKPVEELIGVWETSGYSRLSKRLRERYLKLLKAPDAHYLGSLNPIEAEYEVEVIGEKSLEKRETPDGSNSPAPFHAIIPYERLQRFFPPVGNHRKLLLGRVPQVIEQYETATTPKEKYKAESELCRLQDRLGGYLGDSIIYHREKVLLTSCERYGDYRIPHLRVAISKTPQTQLLTQDEVLNHPLWKFLVGDEKLQIKPGSFYFGRTRGVKNK